MIIKKYPSHDIYGEEYKNKSNNSPFVWVIDPIDGTKNFINGNCNFGTLISLCIDKIPVIGIINCPDINKTWIGIRDNGAYCNGKKIKKSQNNLNLSKFLFQFLLIFLFIKEPLQPLLLSYCSKPFLNASEALVCKFKSIGVLILKPCL